MEKQKQNKEEQMERFMHSSVNVFRTTNNLSIEQDRSSLKKRSSSMLLSNNFVPRLRPIKAIICPSPISLNQKPAGPVQEIQRRTISTASIDSQNDSNLKPIRCIYFRRNPKKSFKIINIEEETYPFSDHANNSDSAKSDDEYGDNNKNKFNNNNKINYFFNNIKIIRKNMAKFRKNYISKENLLDDSNIDNRFVGKRLNNFKNIEQQDIFNNIRKNKFLNLSHLKKIKYRTKSFSIKTRYVSTILGFLEKNNRDNSINSNGK